MTQRQLHIILLVPVVNSNIERTLIDVYRKGTSELTMFDFKMSNQ